ncbi:hypothetical protein BD770DRAFT_401738 [Pilaira anomala]|nr:hypothetical protein BD770DRAFT_401738 [Pilaira anomala]
MTNNIFVPQTFNGERMVNVNLPNRRVGNQPMNESSTTAPTNPNTSTPAAPSGSGSGSTATTPTSTTTTVVPTRLRIAPAVAEATSPKSLKIKASNPPPPPPSASFAPPPPSSSFVQPSSSFAPPPPPPPNTNFSSKPVPYSPHTTKTFQKYWSEANIAVLIQLHRKYFNNNSNDPNLDNTWSLLTKEYNAITCEDRSKQTVKKRWNKVMRKYNAERCCLQIQKTSSQQMPPVSYWNHFLYLDGYLSHLPIPDDSLYIRHDDEDEDEDYDLVGVPEKKRKLDTSKVLESLLEQTMARQQSQIDSIKTHYDDMNKMNLKFVDMCEKVTLRNQSNESRFLDLLEKVYNKTE